MKITVTFDSLDEFQKYTTGLTPVQERAEAPQSGEKAEPKKNTKKAEKPAPEPAPEPEEAPAADPAPEISEDFRVEVRKTLAQLNKKVGKNMASELIKGFGVERLTDVKLSDLPALMERAKEAINAE